MAHDRTSHRYFITVRGEDFPRLFTREGPAREFFEQRKSDVIEFVEEFLEAEFNGYFVWRQNKLYPT